MEILIHRSIKTLAQRGKMEVYFVGGKPEESCSDPIPFTGER